MEAKPIFIVGLPSTGTPDQMDRIAKELKEKMPDYHSLIFQLDYDERPTFQTFYEKDFNEVKYEELKQIIKDSVK